MCQEKVTYSLKHLIIFPKLDIENEDINIDGGNLDNILWMAGIINIKASKFVCLDKDLAVIHTVNSGR